MSRLPNSGSTPTTVAAVQRESDSATTGSNEEKEDTASEALLISFPDYKIQTPVGRVPYLGHAGVVLISPRGTVKYYEYGRYPTKDGTVGRVRRPTGIPKRVVIGPDGLATKKSLGRVLSALSKKAGKKGRIEAAYFVGVSYKKMNDYAMQKLMESNPGNPQYDKNREEYGLYSNNCATFAAAVITQNENVDVPFIINTTPINLVDEYVEEGNARVTFDPKEKTTTVGTGDESDAKVEPTD